ncbi:sensor histidine kinase [Priestia koreensis]|uniref:histidine kinase n=1 Tax=Priestia koreensis TaxID=284581 RepID=A0A0M0LJF6_9BACI|nr:HAMP domain-containing sensor histidine kinase [Priestia koreensis]KOO50843.1 hypothetical protein AMD01_03675 [Priestia koreensis]
MKNRPLFAQILLVFSLLIVIIGITLIFLIKGTLHTFFKNEIYSNIEASQQLFTYGDRSLQSTRSQKQIQNLRSVQHLFINEKGQLYQKSELPNWAVKRFYKEALLQEVNEKRYTLTVKGDVMFYIIRKVKIGEENYYHVSYMWDSYRQELVKTLLSRLMVLIILVLLCGIGIVLLFSKWLAKPIVEMKKHVQRIAKRQWDEPIMMDRKDEIGVLAASIDSMRIQLKAQDEAQQSMLQHISHDLKTPIMVIQSYTEALRDGIYPNGTFETSLDTIQKEADRLQLKIKDLLYLTKLDYMAQQNLRADSVDFRQLIEEVKMRLHTRKSEVNVTINVEEVPFYSDEEQWKVVFENLFDNALKYAKEQIDISIKSVDGDILICFANDGPPIEEALLAHLFEPFQKGKKGQYGLGLAIVKRIASLYRANVYARNTADGVAFYIRIPGKYTGNQALKKG